MSTFITVIVPIYNIEQYLERCINSILNQTYKNFELILVDDGSTDKSGEIADSFAKKDDRVTAIHQENGGSSKARNEAIRKAKGEYLSFIDSDDYIEPDFLERMVVPIEKAKEDNQPIPKFVQIGRDEIDEEGNRLPNICEPSDADVFINSNDFFKELLMHRGDCSFCTKLTARELFDNRLFPVGKLNEDFHILVQMLLEVSGVSVVNGVGYHVFYRMNSNSRRAKKQDDFSRVFADSVDNADMIEKMVKQSDPELINIAERFALFQRLEYLLHIPIKFMNKEYPGYPECVSYIRNHFPGFLKNEYLTKKNKIYLTLFAINPKLLRQIHAVSMKLRGKK